MKSLWLWLSLFVFLVGAARVSAETGEVYDCAFDKTDNKMLAPRVLMMRRDADKKVLVVDDFVKHFMGGPIEAQVNRDDGKRLDIAWEIMVQDNSQNYAKLHVNLVYFRSTGKASMQSKYLGYQNRWVARGTCTSRHGKV